MYRHQPSNIRFLGESPSRGGSATLQREMGGWKRGFWRLSREGRGKRGKEDVWWCKPVTVTEAGRADGGSGGDGASGGDGRREWEKKRGCDPGEV
jgi:hypothetical protein